MKISTFIGGEVSSNMEGYGYRMRTIGSGGALYDPSMDMFQLYVGAGELKAGYGLLKMGVTNLNKAKLGMLLTMLQFKRWGVSFCKKTTGGGNLSLKGVFDGFFIGGNTPENELMKLLKNLIIKIKYENI